MSPEIINRLIYDDMRAVDAVVRESLHSDVALIRQVAEHIIGGGGKRLRPALLVLSAICCGYRGTAHHRLAAVVEFIHTATLLHDDVVDDSELRRGRATANARFGNPASVLVGDFLYSRAFQMMVGVRNLRVLEVLSNATNVIAEGEVLQLLNVQNVDVSEAQYLHVIRSKTAKLFEAAGQLGAILAEAPAPVEAALAGYGTHMGTAFQLIDDILDYSGDLAQTGKNLGDDLAEGKVTLPLIYAMRSGSGEQAGLIRRAITEGRLSDFEPVVAAIRDSGALDYARRQAEAEAERASALLEAVPNSTHKDCLLELSAFAVRRNY